MTIVVETLEQHREDEYEHFMLSLDHALVYSSLNYREFLRRVLTDSQDQYFLAYENGQLAGVLPSFVINVPGFGGVLNSLPFYGSHGGPMVAPTTRDARGVSRALLEAFGHAAGQPNIWSSTIIANPFDPHQVDLASQVAFDFQDSRIGQWTELPDADQNCLREALLKKFPYRRRNIRKAERSEVVTFHSDQLRYLQTLHAIHQDNMATINGSAKPWRVFEAISETFNYGNEYRVYAATIDDRIVAALLLLYHNKTVEYFTPVVRNEARTLQPLPLLIFHAMQDACRNGYRRWNWGGTWNSQEGVFRFKERWASHNQTYHYYTKLQNRALVHTSQADLLSRYPYYYVLPFDQLKSAA